MYPPMHVSGFKRLLFIGWLLALGDFSLIAQSDSTQRKDQPKLRDARKFYLGIAFGTSYALGNFGDTDINNADAGYAQNGNRYDLYGGYFFNDRVTLTAGLRYQRFGTDLSDVVDFFQAREPGVEFDGASGDWQTYYLLLGAAYRVPLGKRLTLYPRVAVGPLWTTSPGLEVQATNGGSGSNFFRSSETGFGVGYEVGVGLRTDLGKRFSLLPTFTFSGGWANIKDVENRLDDLAFTRDFEVGILSFNLGLSLAVRL